ncbi:hypothetical protein [Myxococcus sp. RHSTA-1-4]|uniref:hypothetical protein n=1 Tax=Myxococcus sp. RHSTA-1-4 TaxID=2874601 RepID=UPI001CBB32AB|nr:hypothetical protein [Myxococcus sp. RHSTA-1-4]MBZ4422188.1 hypothetical protein [Myxococcus sp. RHSTA-1-4]
MLLVFATLMLLGVLSLRQQLQGERAMWGVVLVAMLVAALASNLLPPSALMGWALAALPAVLVVHHGFYLSLIKPRFISREVLTGRELGPRELANIKEMVDANERYFGTSNIALRYGLPALAIVAIGAVAVHVLNPASKGALNIVLVKDGQQLIGNTTLEAARLGAVGAYVYVLLYLGQRGFRHDVTSGAALWCAVTLALGPLMAASLSKVWVKGMGGSDVATGWGTLALYFGVGMAPRYVAQAIARQAQRIGADASKFVSPERSVPLAMLRGVTPQVEERLHEEGIHDVAGMAMADPLRLQRNTNFDKHQILGWMDAALLAQALPDAWEDLEKKGLRGARDLCWYVSGSAAEKAKGFSELAVNGLTEPLLNDVALRLSQDSQVQRIQLLYQLVEDARSTEARSAQGSASETLTSGLRGLSEVPPAAPVATGAAETPAEALQAPAGDGAPRPQA